MPGKITNSAPMLAVVVAGGAVEVKFVCEYFLLFREEMV